MIKLSIKGKEKIEFNELQLLTYFNIGLATQGISKLDGFPKKKIESLSILGNIQYAIDFRDRIIHGTWDIDNLGNIQGIKNNEKFNYTSSEINEICVKIWRNYKNIDRTLEELKSLNVSGFIAVSNQINRPDEVSYAKDNLKKVLNSFKTIKEIWFIFDDYEKNSLLRFVCHLQTDLFSIVIYPQQYTLHCDKCQKITTPIRYPHRELNRKWNITFGTILKNLKEKRTFCEHVYSQLISKE